MTALDREQAEAARISWRCKAQRTADPPQDCDWPLCGCDDYANRVIAVLDEIGMLKEVNQ